MSTLKKPPNQDWGILQPNFTTIGIVGSELEDEENTVDLSAYNRTKSSEPPRTGIQDRILELFQADAPKPMTVGSLIQKLQVYYPKVVAPDIYGILGVLLKRKQIERVEQGVYRATMKDERYSAPTPIAELPKKDSTVITTNNNHVPRTQAPVETNVHTLTNTAPLNSRCELPPEEEVIVTKVLEVIELLQGWSERNAKKSVAIERAKKIINGIE